MSTATEEILSRYKRTESETDKFGRVIVCRKLKPAEQTRIMKMADSNVSAVVLPYMVAASVVKIDDAVYAFPRNEGEIEAVLNVLDDEGLTAATDAYVRVSGGKDANAAGSMEQIKNS